MKVTSVKLSDIAKTKNLIISPSYYIDIKEKEAEKKEAKEEEQELLQELKLSLKKLENYVEQKEKTDIAPVEKEWFEDVDMLRSLQELCDKNPIKNDKE